RRLSRGELRRRVLELAGAIRAHLGGADGRRVALTGGAGVDPVVAYLATVAAGGCAVPLPTSLTPEALGGMIGDCEPALAFTAPALQDIVTAALGPAVASIRLDGEGLSRFVAGTEPLAAA